MSEAECERVLEGHTGTVWGVAWSRDGRRALSGAQEVRSEALPPRGFRSIELGMELEQVKELLIEDPLFDYRGDPDISFLPQPPQHLYLKMHNRLTR